MKISRCKSCGEEIVWLKTNSGKSMPVNKDSICDVCDEGADTFNPDQMISHFATCPDSDKFRKKK